MPLPPAAVQSALSSYKRGEQFRNFRCEQKCLQDIFFFVGGCEAPLKSASAASGWSKRSHPYEHDTSTMSNGAGSAELLCALSRQQEVWNWLDPSLFTPWLTICVLDWSFWYKQNRNAESNAEVRAERAARDGTKRKTAALRGKRVKKKVNISAPDVVKA